MGTLRPLIDDYQPPTADQLARRAVIREKIELLSVRPIQDHGPLNGYADQRIRAGAGTGLVFCIVAATLLVAALMML